MKKLLCLCLILLAGCQRPKLVSCVIVSKSMYTKTDILGCATGGTYPVLYLKNTFHYTDGHSFISFDKERVSFNIWQRYQVGDKYP